MEESIVGEVKAGVTEELPKLILIEDLGMMYATETSKKKSRFGIYECGFCGQHFKTKTDNVKNGTTKSCGCYRKSQASKSHNTHGGRKNNLQLYDTWKNMKSRTSNRKRKDFERYGGRGISVCDEWKYDFVAFREWALENGYEENKGLSIDRIDNDGNYEPNNCRWVVASIQVRNQRIRSTNTSGYKGVHFRKGCNRFVAYIYINKKQIYLGSFKTAIEGGIAYNNYIVENNLEGFILNVIPNEVEEIKND